MPEKHHHEILFTRAEIPPEYKEIPVRGDSRESARCVICQHHSREAIETVGLSGMGMKAAAEYVDKNFGLKISSKQLRTHLSQHFSDNRSLKFAQLYQGMGDIPDDAPLATAQGIILLMLGDALSKIIGGEVEIQNLADIEKVVKLYQASEKFKHDQQMDERKMENEEQSGMSAVDAMRQLGYVMLALRETVPEDILEKAVNRAWSLGLNMDYRDISEVPLYQSDYVEPDMSLAVSDVNVLGRKRTRKELEAGDFEPVEGEDVPPED